MRETVIFFTRHLDLTEEAFKNARNHDIGHVMGYTETLNQLNGITSLFWLYEGRRDHIWIRQ